MLRFFVLWLSIAVSFYVIIGQLDAIEVVTEAGKILGVAAWSAVAAALQMMFMSGKLQKYRFSLTLLILSFTSAAVVKVLPGYTLKDINLLLMVNIFGTFASIILAMVFKPRASVATKSTKRKK